MAVARELKVTPGTVTGTLNPLEEMGLIERLRGKARDRRIEDRMSFLSDDEMSNLIALLGKIAAPHPGVPESWAASLKRGASRRGTPRG